MFCHPPGHPDLRRNSTATTIYQLTTTTLHLCTTQDSQKVPPHPLDVTNAHNKPVEPLLPKAPPSLRLVDLRSGVVVPPARSMVSRRARRPRVKCSWMILQVCPSTHRGEPRTDRGGPLRADRTGDRETVGGAARGGGVWRSLAVLVLVLGGSMFLATRLRSDAFRRVKQNVCSFFTSYKPLSCEWYSTTFLHHQHSSKISTRETGPSTCSQQCVYT